MRLSPRHLIGNRSGSVLVMAAACMPLLVAAAGLATDTVQWTLWKRQVQRQADSAALAGAYAVAQGFSASDSATSDISQMSLIALSYTPVIENAPTAGSYAGNNRAVRVVLQTAQELPFSKMLGITAPVIRGEATAAVISQGEYCVVSLEPTTAVGITLQGNATVDLGCGIMTNSRGSSAINAGGSSVVKASPVAAVGGLQTSSNYADGTTLIPYAVPEADPYASLPMPAASGCTGKVTVNPQATRALTPGCYKGLDIKGTVSLSPGTYYIDGSSFSAGSQAVITGTDVTIILTSSSAATNPSQIATLDINGGATINLSSPQSGTYSGVLFYQDRRALDSGTNKVNGNASSGFQGSFYFPSQQLEFSGTAGMTTKCVKMVSRRVTFIGNSKIENQCDDYPGTKDIAATVVRLVN